MEKLLNLDIKSLKKNNAYYTAKEIDQQPRLWIETVSILEKKRNEIQAYIQKKKLIPGLRIILTGAGTSAYVGDTVASYLSKKLNLRIEAIPTTSIVSSPEDYFQAEVPTILVSFARSGNSPESLAAYNLAEQIVQDLSQIVITCNEEGELAKQCIKNNKNLLLFMPKESDDKSFAMTSSFTCMLLTSLLIFDMDNFDSNVKVIENVGKRGRAILDTKIEEIAELVKLGYERVIYLGSSSLAGLSKEAALKNLELTSGKICTISESTLGFRHGPKSIINEKTLVFVFVSSDEYTRKYELDIIKEIYNDKGTHKVVPIVQTSEWNLNNIAYKVLTTDDSCIVLEDTFSALDYILYAQLFAFFYSLSLGVTPDNPRPDGTVSRVVKGVTIYEYVK
jgi:tagatose-6-phosphate ketose/aldose isomerase